MAEKKNVPDIRFKGFSEEWIKQDLHQLVDVRSGRDYKHLSTGNIPVYGTGGYMLSVNDALSYNEDAVGIGRKGTIDKPYILKAPFWTVDTLFYAVPKENNHLAFVYDIFQNISWKQKNEATGVPSLSKVAINSISVNSTSYTEQTRIGTYFQKLDQLISLHQGKYDKLVILKKAMLEKMFPKNGADVPEIRFKGFEGKWEENKLGEIGKITMGQSPNSINYTDNPEDFILVQGNADMKNGKVVPRVWTKQITKTADVGDLIMSVRAPVGELGKTTYNVVIGRGVAAIKGNEFIFQSLKKMNENGYWKRFSAGSTFDSINSSELSNAIILVTTYEEQTKIGNYFQKLDNLILLHQKELEKLRNIKKACLEKMFV